MNADNLYNYRSNDSFEGRQEKLVCCARLALIFKGGDLLSWQSSVLKMCILDQKNTSINFT